MSSSRLLTRRTRFRHLAILLIPLAFSACLSDNSITPPVSNCPDFAPATSVDLAASTKTASGLQYRDLTVGTGKTVTAGDILNVRYIGTLENGTVFDQGTYSFKIPGNVIQGWNEGLIGMKICGQRQLIIPPALGYGASANGPIPANSVLIFTVQPI